MEKNYCYRIWAWASCGQPLMYVRTVFPMLAFLGDVSCIKSKEIYQLLGFEL